MLSHQKSHQKPYPQTLDKIHSSRIRIRRALLASTFLWILGLGSLSHSSSAPPDLPEQLREIGFEVLNKTPIPFALQDLTGQSKSLMDFKGKWILLLFWATWCPVCVDEIPTLQRFYDKFKDPRLAILSISGDENLDALKEFVAVKKITFPVWHDLTRKVAFDYQATGVPSFYLISPDWRLVGLGRGAFNWDRPDLVEKFKKLLTIDKISDGLLADSKKLTLPSELTAPKVDAHFVGDKSGATLRTDNWYGLEITVRWDGSSERYALKSPQINLPPEIERGTLSSSSGSKEGSSLLKFHLPIRFRETGRFHLGPIDLTYLPRQGGSSSSAQTTRHAGMEIELPKPQAIWPGFVALGLTLLLALGSVFWYRKKRQRAMQGLEENQSKFPSTDVSQQYQDARGVKVHGKLSDYDLRLLGLAKVVHEQHPGLQGRIQDQQFLKGLDGLREKIQYGGYSFSDAERNRLEKIVEWSLTEESFE